MSSLGTPLPRRTSSDWLLCALAAAAIFLCVVPGSESQELSPLAIRVESDQVVVPVLVWDKRRWDGLLLPTDPSDLQRERAAKDMPWRDPTIRGLRPRDFQVFEDGRAQTVQSVTLEDPAVTHVRDSAGQHYEVTGSGGGRWIYPDIPSDGKMRPVTVWSVYMISYTPPASPEGSCHQVKVKVANQSDAAVLGNDRYCRTKFFPSDPLLGTKFGNKMEKELMSPAAETSISLSLAAVLLFSDTNQARIQIAIEFPPQSLSYKLSDGISGDTYETIGTVALAYAKDGRVVARSSDFDCCDRRTGLAAFSLDYSAPGLDADILTTPRAYETQLYLSSGDDDLRVIVSDDHKFGRAETPLTVPLLDAQHLAVSDIALAKRVHEASKDSQDAFTKYAGTYVPLVSNGIEFTPTADPYFHKGDAFYFYFEVYEPQLTAPRPPTVQFHMRIVDAKTSAVVKDSRPRDSARFVRQGKPVIPIGDGIDISNLSSGAYRLEVQVTDSTGQTTPWHTANCTIE
jgi:hypothetical protein